MYLMEDVEDIGLVLKEVDVFTKPNTEVGKVINNKCYGFSKEQCVSAFYEYAHIKIKEIQDKAQEECSRYFKYQADLHEIKNELSVKSISI